MYCHRNDDLLNRQRIDFDCFHLMMNEVLILFLGTEQELGQSRLKRCRGGV
ncbi:unnamed protein product [Brassica oleracea var. botrytis]|uniref:Uncharacterized protein n=3 Tax=Brassica TaxID=3705 RepID=A0A0D3BK15_BRAOL|nr:unnamed protein product [Brassica napus]CDY71826.1 BnaCnng74660D [Brassica napus]VDC98913.1 unnamed protein product [Brassica oleracea]